METSPARANKPGPRTGSRRNEAGVETRQRLLDAAEHLFATRGLDAVSVRDITELAEANTAAIHYHFGSKQDLVAGVLQRRSPAIGERRAELLEPLEAQRRRPDLREVLRVLVLPTAELAASSEGGRHYVAFLAALGDNAELMPVVGDLFDTYTDRYLAVLARATPKLPDDVRVLRFAVGKDLINRALGRPEGQVHQWIDRHHPGADAYLVDSLLDLLVGMFQGPVTVSEASARTA